MQCTLLICFKRLACDNVCIMKTLKVHFSHLVSVLSQYNDYIVPLESSAYPPLPSSNVKECKYIPRINLIKMYLAL